MKSLSSVILPGCSEHPVNCHFQGLSLTSLSACSCSFASLSGYLYLCNSAIYSEPIQHLPNSRSLKFNKPFFQLSFPGCDNILSKREYKKNLHFLYSIEFDGYNLDFSGKLDRPKVC